MKKLILASRSPRRKELLTQQGFEFDIIVSNHHETLNPALSPERNAIWLSQQKAKEVGKKRNGIILAADTLVVTEGKIIGKPKDKDDARRMLKLFSGDVHTVITAFTLYDTENKKEYSEAVKTDVHFRDLTDSEIESYISTDEPYDKAGGYAIQEEADAFVKNSEGSYSNVVGLPIEEVTAALKSFGIFPKKD